MAIHEESFRIGSGRYLQGSGYISKCADEILRYGNSVLVVGGVTALSVAGKKICAALDKASVRYTVVTYVGSCNEESAKQIAKQTNDGGFETVLGVGGGVIMDFAKLCAHFASVPIINVPTSSATCAAFTPLSVCYTKEGRTVGTRHYKKEVDAVIVDTEIIAAAPTRLFLSGVFDSLAKFVEIKHRYSEESEEYPLGLDYAYAMAERSFSQLYKLGFSSIEKMKRGVTDSEVERAIFSTVAVPGIISGVARGSNQTALAHKFYEATRFLFPSESSPYLHGEIVGVGLLMQNYHNGEEEKNEYILSLMKAHSMPYRVSDLGVPTDIDSFEKYYGYICGSSAVANNEQECKKFRGSLEYLWNSGLGDGR